MLSLDRLRLGIEAIVEAMLRPRIDYLALYPARVVAQNANGLELLPDDERVRGEGLTGIPLRHGLPGYTVRVTPGARVLLGFEAGDPSRPYAALWEPGQVEEVCFDGGAENIARTGDSAGELYVDTLTLASVPSAPNLWYRSPRGTGVWSLVLTGAGPPVPTMPGTPVVIDEGNEKLKA